MGASISGNSSCAAEFNVQLTNDRSETTFRVSSNSLSAEIVAASCGSHARLAPGRNVRKTGPAFSCENSSRTWVAVKSNPGPTITPLPRMVSPSSSILATATSASPASCSDANGPTPSSAVNSTVLQDNFNSDSAGFSVVTRAEWVLWSVMLKTRYRSAILVTILAKSQVTSRMSSIGSQSCAAALHPGFRQRARSGRIGRLGREGSNLQMAESKSGMNLNRINGHPEFWRESTRGCSGSVAVRCISFKQARSR